MKKASIASIPKDGSSCLAVDTEESLGEMWKCGNVKGEMLAFVCWLLNVAEIVADVKEAELGLPWGLKTPQPSEPTLDPLYTRLRTPELLKSM